MRLLPSFVLGTLVAVALAATSRPAVAQSAADRAAIEQFRDSIGGISDTMALRGLEASMIERAKANRDDAMLHLRLGFVSLRLGELGGKSHFDNAASEFQWAIDLQPEWPYSWYGMGLAEYAVGDSRVSAVAGLQAMMGKDALSRSAVAFAQSATVDPSFVHGLVELGTTALRQRVNIKLDVALDALRRAAATKAGDNPEVLLVRGRVEREAGDADSALAVFREYAASGANPGLGHLELARTLLMLGRPDGRTEYYAGAASNDPAAVDGYRADIAVIAPDSVLTRFDAASGDARVALLREFWSERDQAGLRVAGERLQEHYRRLAYARRNFALASENRRYDIVERYRSGSTDFDDRGIIYIRHGDPSDRARYTGQGVEPNESWRYARADGDLLFHFVAREDVQDFKLVESVFDVLGFANALRLEGSENDPSALTTAGYLLDSRTNLAPVYGRLQGAGSIGASQIMREERRVGQRSIAEGTTTDSYELRFARPLEARTAVLAVGSDSSGTLLQVTYAIAGSELQPVRIEQGFVYPIRLRFAALDESGHVVASADTTRYFVARQPVPPGEHLVGRLAVPAPAGKLTYRLALQQGSDAGQVLPRDTVRVASAGRFGVSDIVLGSRMANLAWQPAAGDTVFFNPIGTFRPEDEMHLYYEVFGLTPGEQYSTRLEVKREGGGGGFLRRLFGGGGAAISLRFDDTAVEPVEAEQRILELDRLKPGRYMLEVTITDADGSSERRRQPFEVVRSAER